MKWKQYIWGMLRIGLGWIFLWAFVDKLLGLGFSTTAEKAWIAGVSPTNGFLLHATAGPFASLYQNIAGNFVDWLFMMGLLLMGLSLLLGIGVRIASYAGALLLFLMWAAVLPPAHNPLIDEHIIYLLILLLLPEMKAGQYLGLGKWWQKKIGPYHWLE